ncbi:hypothetical protein ACIQGZ_26100 [Streptomyces sp. NPDC092296]|uniref:hypothetical protein n=1 Tax=Streptomyces sp. NPDC092296 TaxID=3366012 RepID=UPI00380B510C
MSRTDQRTTARTEPLRPHRAALAAAILLAAAGITAGASSCSSSPNTSTGTPPVPSAATGAPGAPTPSATGAPSTPGGGAASFQSSVAAQASSARASASAALKSVTGQGNAVADVRLTGIPATTPAGRPATAVHITNHSGKQASYAVRIDFVDSAGKAVQSTVVGTRDLAAGASATVLAFGAKTSTAPTTPKVAKAQRY